MIGFILTLFLVIIIASKVHQFILLNKIIKIWRNEGLSDEEISKKISYKKMKKEFVYISDNDLKKKVNTYITYIKIIRLVLIGIVLIVLFNWIRILNCFGYIKN